VANYSFLTRWQLDASIEKVWDTVSQFDQWPRWWKGVVSAVELESGDGNGVGGLWRYTWKSALPYTLTFDTRVTRAEPPVALDGIATGELAGEGRWRLYRSGEGTLVRYEWNVGTTSAWMNLLAPVARPLFAWNHDVVMRQGCEGLARLLAT
jgi:uncharacterized protein YndB with AHSA1/START domain